MHFSKDLAPLFAAKRSAPSVALPVKATVTELINVELVIMLFAEDVKTYVKRNRELESNLATVYSVAWGQCSEDMKARIKTTKGYQTAAEKNDCLWLLKSTKAVPQKFEGTGMAS